jgi:hypothetical protein
MEDILKAVASQSFPVVVAAYLLIKTERELRRLSGAIDRLRHCQVCRYSPVLGDANIDADVDSIFDGGKPRRG